MTNILERLEKLSAKIFQESLKTFYLKDVIAHKTKKPSSLIERLALYPNKGVGFNVRRKGWPKNINIRLTEVIMKSNCHGKLKGMRYRGSKQQWLMPKRFTGASKRGIWEIQLQPVDDLKLDNEMVYTMDDYAAYFNLRKPQTPLNAVEEQQVESEAVEGEVDETFEKEVDEEEAEEDEQNEGQQK